MLNEKTAMSLFKSQKIPDRTKRNKKHWRYPIKNKIYYWSGKGKKSILLQSDRFDVYQGKRMRRGYFYFNIIALKNGLQFQATYVIYIKSASSLEKKTYHFFTPLPISLFENMHTLIHNLPPEFQRNLKKVYQYSPRGKFLIPNKEYYMQSGYKELLSTMIEKNLIIEWKESHPIQRKNPTRKNEATLT